jgi:hypothetical protein
MWDSMHLHEFSWKNIELSKFTFFLVHMWYSMYSHALAWISMKNYWTFKVHFFLSLDVRFNALSCTCMNFHEKYKNLKFTLFIVQIWDSMHLHEFSWKNIELSKFTFFLVHMWFSMYSHALAWISMKNYWTFKVHFFLSLDVRFNALNFHEKYKNLKFTLFIVQIWDSMHLHEFSWKNIELSKFTFILVQMWDSMHCHALVWIFIKKY